MKKKLKTILSISIIAAIATAALAITLPLTQCNHKPKNPHSNSNLSYEKDSYRLTKDLEIAEEIIPLFYDENDEAVTSATYYIDHGSLPAGVEIDHETGKISGTPTTECSNVLVSIGAKGTGEYEKVQSNLFDIHITVGNKIIDQNSLKIINNILVGFEQPYSTDLGTELVIPEGVTTISNTFNPAIETRGITSVYIPSTLETIERDAFLGDPIESFDVSEENSLFERKQIGENGWALGTKNNWDGYPVGKIAYGDLYCGVRYDNPTPFTEIKQNQYEGCAGLTKITLSSTINKINSHTFGGCTQASEMIFEDGFNPDTGGWWYEDWLSGLNNEDEHSPALVIDSLTIPNSLTYNITEGYFKDCIIHSVTIDANNPNCEFLSNDLDGKILVPKTTTWDTFTKPAWGIAFGDIEIPDTPNHIVDYNFSNCLGITSLVFSEGIEEISGNFSWLYSLKSISLPSSLNEINAETDFLNNCLEEINFDGSDAYSLVPISDNGKAVIPGTNKVKWDNDSVAVASLAYGNIEFDDDIIQINERGFMGCGGIINAKLGNNVLSIDALAFAYCRNLEKVIFNGSLNEIKWACFTHCKKLAYINLPTSVGSIGLDAFFKTGITSIIIPKNVSIIKMRAFWMSNISHIVFLNENCEFEDYAFAYCTKLANIDLSGTDVEELNDAIFIACTQLKQVSLNDSVNVLKGSCFEGCISLEHVNGIENLELIGKKTFEMCYSLTEFSLNSNDCFIDANAFNDCISLNEIDLTGLSRIGKEVFEGADSLDTLNVPESLVTIEDDFLNNSSISHLILNIPENFDFSNWNSDAFKNDEVPVGTITNNGSYDAESLLAKLTSDYQLPGGWTYL